MIYIRNKKYFDKKAIQTFRDVFILRINNPRWLAEKAILTYEAADNIKMIQEMLDQVASLF